MSYLLHMGRGNMFRVTDSDKIALVIEFENKIFSFSIDYEESGSSFLHVSEIYCKEHLKTIKIGSYKQIIILNDKTNNSYLVVGDQEIIAKMSQFEYSENCFTAFITFKYT